MNTRSAVAHHTTINLDPGPGAIIRKVEYRGNDYVILPWTRNDVKYLKNQGIIAENEHGVVTWNVGRGVKLPMFSTLRYTLRHNEVRCFSNYLYMAEHHRRVRG